MIALRYILLLAAIVLGGNALVAQTASAEDYFNRAAKQYVKEDKVNALRTLDKALQEYPGDARLLKLAEELLKEDQQQQQQQQQQDQDKKKEGEEEKKDGGEQEKPQDGDEKKQDRGDEEKKGDQQKPQPGKISQQEAERILDAMNRQEKEVQEKVRNRERPTPRTPIEKDW